MSSPSDPLADGHREPEIAECMAYYDQRHPGVSSAEREGRREQPMAEVTQSDGQQVRVVNGWWCDMHQEVHMGDLGSWSMEHRARLHPLYVHRRTDVNA